MNVLQLYSRKRGVSGGEESVIELLGSILEEHGHQTSSLSRSSCEIEGSLVRKISAALSGVFNPFAYRSMLHRLRVERPDIVHVHNVYPWFSPSVLIACRHERIPVILHIHSHILTCPTWYHFREGRVCEECIGGYEYRCVLKDCRDDIFESTAYALRSAVARRFRLFHDNVNVLIALTPFTKWRLLQAGFREDQIVVLPNPTSVRETDEGKPSGKYVAFAGRVSPEKGVDTFLAAAARMPDVPFKVAGDGPLLSGMIAKAPGNVEFLGKLGFDELQAFYRGARVLVVPSLGFELFGMVAVDAMALGVPVIASRTGGLPYVVEDGITGLLFEPGDPQALLNKIRRMWGDAEICRRMGEAGRQKVIRKYSQDVFYRNLMVAYQAAIQRARNCAAVLPE